MNWEIEFRKKTREWGVRLNLPLLNSFAKDGLALERDGFAEQAELTVNF